MADEDSIFYYYQKLIRLRREAPILIRGTFELIAADDERVFAYTRTWENETWLIVCNFYEECADFSYIGKGLKILSNYETEAVRDLSCIELRPYEAGIYELAVL